MTFLTVYMCKQRRINKTPYIHRVGHVSKKVWKRRNRHVSVQYAWKIIIWHLTIHFAHYLNEQTSTNIRIFCQVRQRYDYHAAN